MTALPVMGIACFGALGGRVSVVVIVSPDKGIQREYNLIV